MKKIFIVFLFTIYGLLFTAVPTFAKVVSSEEAISIAADEVIDDDLYIGGPTVEVAGIVNGDLYVGAGTVDITGEIKGDILAGSGIINISGKVGNDVRAAGGQISISGAEIGGGLTIFGGNVFIDENTKIGGGVLVGAGQVIIDADINRGIVGGAGTLIIGGKVGKEIKVGVDTLTIKKGAEITGDISYTSENKIEITDGAVISGKVSQAFPPKTELPKGLPGIAKKVGLGFKVFAFFAALLIGSVLIYFLPKHTNAISMRILEKPSQSLLWGFLISMLICPAFILLMITGIGVPLGFILLGIFIFGLYIAKIFIGILFGHSLLEFFGKKEVNAYLSLALGLLVYYILVTLPIIGPFVALATLLFGLGALFAFIREALVSFRQS